MQAALFARLYTLRPSGGLKATSSAWYVGATTLPSRFQVEVFIEFINGNITWNDEVCEGGHDLDMVK